MSAKSALSGGAATGLFDDVWIVNEGLTTERIIIVEAKGGRAANPLSKSFGAGRKVTDAAGEAKHAVQGSPEYFEDVLVAMEASTNPTVSGVADRIRAMQALNPTSPRIGYYLASATWRRTRIPGREVRVFQAADRSKLYQLQITPRP